MQGFLGGSAASVVARLLIVSFIVGLLLTMIGFDPETIYARVAEIARHILDYGFDDIRHIGRILLTGVMVVAPIWFVLRLMDVRRTR